MNRHGLRSLVHAYRSARSRASSCVLATVISTLGSSYRKAGARMLIETDADAARLTGIVGGGCFDDDLLEHARSVSATETAQIRLYDMTADDDVLWGLGMGCNGAVEVLLQPLNHAADNVMDLLGQLLDRGGRLATRLDPQQAAVGHSWIVGANEFTDAAAAGVYADGSVFVDLIAPRYKLGIFGAGSDVLPVVELADQLDWDILIWDHRPGHARPDRFPAASQVEVFSAGAPAAAAACDALLIMSHNFDADRRFLAAIVELDTPYIGVLGPATRRERLLAELGSAGLALNPRLRGPVGLNLGGDLPEEIALSAIAQIQQLRHRRSAAALDQPDQAR